jgi:hypothetical protein
MTYAGILCKLVTISSPLMKEKCTIGKLVLITIFVNFKSIITITHICFLDQLLISIDWYEGRWLCTVERRSYHPGVEIHTLLWYLSFTYRNVNPRNSQTTFLRNIVSPLHSPVPFFSSSMALYLVHFFQRKHLQRKRCKGSFRNLLLVWFWRCFGFWRVQFHRPMSTSGRNILSPFLGLKWRKSKSKSVLRLTDSQPVCLGVEPYWDSWPDFSLQVLLHGLCHMGHPV